MPFFNEEVDALSLPTIESWVPPAVADAAERLHAEFAAENKSESLAVLSRLIRNPRMRVVWVELYKKNRVNYRTTEEFLYPARATNASWAAIHRRQAAELRKVGGKLNESEAKLLEAEATMEESAKDPHTDTRWSEQDRAVQIFLCHACHSAVDIQPVFLADIQDKLEKLGRVSASLRAHAQILQSFGMNGDAQKLGEVAADCDDEARNLEPTNPRADDPWIITRDRGDPKLRTFVIDLSIPTHLLFGKSLYGQLATVANVVFSRDDITGLKVSEWLRDRPPRV